MISVKWYGLNALEFRHEDGMFLIDPYVSRNREKVIVPEEQQKYLTMNPDFVLMTHAHWDHLADMPYLIAQTDTVLYASGTACNIMRAYGVPEKNLREITYGDTLKMGGVTIDVIESRHMGNIPEDDCYTEVPDPVLLEKADNWRCGKCFAFRIRMEDMTILDSGSANFYEPAMKGLECDIFIAGISRWQSGFPERLMENIRFRTLIPVHHDEFRKPLSEFELRDDMERLKQAIPELNYKELPILESVNLKGL